jgi:hypothetical protein
VSRWRRLTRWEFWPRWAFYPPVVLYVLWLALRHRSLTLFSAVNPAIPGGGFVGESKAAILDGLRADRDRVARYQLLPASLTLDARIARVRAFRERLGLGWPIVLKPDVGERGSGVTLARADQEVRAYLEGEAGDSIVQEFVPGQEFGVFYFRQPEADRGEIFSITEKRFPTVVGDGRSTLEDLILRDDRAVCMATLHLRKHAARLTWVPEQGRVIPLVELGTHARGALFLDGAWVRTAALEDAIERLSRGFDGFWFGRYDIRTADLQAFREGRDFKVVELNGATAEATSIYDPRNPLGSAYRTLWAQWRHLFTIAAANVARGARPATLRELWRLVRLHREAMRGRE